MSVVMAATRNTPEDGVEVAPQRATPLLAMLGVLPAGLVRNHVSLRTVPKRHRLCVREPRLNPSFAACLDRILIQPQLLARFGRQ